MDKETEETATGKAVFIDKDGTLVHDVPYNVDPRYVRLVTNAARTLGRTCPTRSTGGGSDANVFITRGIEVANLACGMRDIHTVNEWVDVKDLVATAELVLETVKANATPA